MKNEKFDDMLESFEDWMVEAEKHLERVRREAESPESVAQYQVMVNEKIPAYERNVERVRATINREINKYVSRGLEKNEETKVWRNLEERGFQEIRSLEELKEDDWIARLISDRGALLFKVPVVRIENAGQYTQTIVQELVCTKDEPELEARRSCESSICYAYKKLELDRNKVFLFALKIPKNWLFEPKLENPIVFDPCIMSYDSENNWYKYKLTKGEVKVEVNGLTVPYHYCLRHERVGIRELLE